MKKVKSKEELKCPCGSGEMASQCCFVLINTSKMATSPEQLMRSRFTAYSQNVEAYIADTWHESTRPFTLALEKSMKWTGLKILHASKVVGNSAYVEFIADFNQVDSSGQRHTGQMHERSRFVREDDIWFYVDGEQIETNTCTKTSKIGRNDPCYCGSGRKFKKCCGSS